MGYFLACPKQGKCCCLMPDAHGERRGKGRPSQRHMCTGALDGAEA